MYVLVYNKIDFTVKSIIKGSEVPDGYTLKEPRFLKNLWSDSNQDFIDVSTQSEKKKRDDLILKNEKKNNKERLLKKGVIVNNYFFNEQVLKNFISARSIIKELGLSSIEWKDIDGNWNVLSLDESLQIQVQAFQKIQEIYKNN